MTMNSIISKTNKAGYISKIITTVLLIISICSFIMMSTLCFYTATYPDENLKITKTTTAEVSHNPKELSGLKYKCAFEAAGIKNNGLTLDNTHYKFSDVNIGIEKNDMTVEPLTQTFTYKDMLANYIAQDAFILATIVALFFIRKLCVSFQNCKTPFCKDVIKNLRTTAVCLIPWSVVALIPSIVNDIVFGNRITVNFGASIAVIIISVFVIGVSHIFTYGEALQNESDSTL